MSNDPTVRRVLAHRARIQPVPPGAGLEAGDNVAAQLVKVANALEAHARVLMSQKPPDVTVNSPDVNVEPSPVTVALPADRTVTFYHDNMGRISSAKVTGIDPDELPKGKHEA
jgi:hypothetical protein